MDQVKEQKDTLVKVNREACEFLVSRKSMTDPEILKIEKEKIFKKCWLYLGHESEVRNPNDFVVRKVLGRSIIFTRDSDGNLRALLNTCRHRGAMVCRDRQGNAKTFQCFYHAWTYDTKGELVGIPERNGYPDNFNCDRSKNLVEVPRIDSYREFVFINFDPDAMELVDFLGGATEYIDLIADMSEVGMEITGGTHEYSVRANWKLLGENALDGYHLSPTHKTYFEYLRDSNVDVTISKGERAVIDLGNGHAVTEKEGLPWGRPVAKWVTAWGEKERKEIDEILGKLIARFGKERALRIAERDRNMLIFPNLVINDIMAITVRTYDPIAPDYTEVIAWSLAPKEESDAFKATRLNNFLDFLGPGGFATPDDMEALEIVQMGLKNEDVEWNDISKGMNKETPHSRDELQMRIFWEKWNEMMQ